MEEEDNNNNNNEVNDNNNNNNNNETNNSVEEYDYDEDAPYGRDENGRPYTQEEYDQYMYELSQQELYTDSYYNDNNNNDNNNDNDLDNNNNNTIDNNNSDNNNNSSDAQPQPPPPPPTSGMKVDIAEVQTVRHYLQQALKQDDVEAMRDLIQKAKKLHISMKDGLLSEASTRLEALDAAALGGKIEMAKYYLKQAMESDKREALKVALDKARELEVDDNELNNLVNKAQERFHAMSRQAADTIKYYLNEGLRSRSRIALKEAMDQANSIESGLIDQSLLAEAAKALQRMDAEHLMFFYLESSMKQKDMNAIESALGKAAALNMDPSHPKIKDAQAKLARLKEKERKKMKKEVNRSTLKEKIFGKNKGKPKLFGEPLESLVERSPYLVPKIMYICVEYLRKYAKEAQGLFRIAGNRDVMEGIKRRMQEEKDDVQLSDVNDTAGILKQFLRSLPEPLIPFSLYREFIDLSLKHKNDNEELVKDLKAAIDKLPEINKNSMRYLMNFLKDLTKYKDVNMMTSGNIAIVFAPNLLKAEDDQQSMLVDMPQAIRIVGKIIDHCEEVLEPLPKDCLKDSTT